jgi:hypothetical protein
MPLVKIEIDTTICKLFRGFGDTEIMRKLMAMCTRSIPFTSSLIKLLSDKRPRYWDHPKSP